MKILLVNPPRPSKSMWDVDAAYLPPLALEYLVAHLPPEAQVKIVDAVVDNSKSADVVKAACAFQPDWVGLTALALPSVSTAVDIAGGLKRAGLTAPIVMGGVAVSAVAQDVLSTGVVDYVVRSEGDVTFRELVCAADPHQVAGLAFCEQGSFVCTPARPPLTDLDAHLPARICERSKYTAFGKRVDAIETSRGTPPDHWRSRSAASVVNEIATLTANGTQLIVLLDDQFMVDMDRVQQICDALVERQVRPLMWCHGNLEAIRQAPQTVSRMREAGFVALLLTLESLDWETGTRRENVRRAVEILHESDIGVWGTVLIGGIEHNGHQPSELVDFLKELDLEFVQIGFITPYPGTPLYAECQRQGLLLSRRWVDYHPHRPVFRMPVGPETAPSVLSQLYKPYYLRAEFAQPRVWSKLCAEDPRLAKLIQLYNPAGIRTARDVVREGFLKSTWPRLLNRYCAPNTLTEWAALLTLASQLVNSHLAQQFPDYCAAICLDTDIGRGWLKIIDGEIDGFSAQNDEAHLILKLNNAAWRELMVALAADPVAVLAPARTAGSQEALDNFIRYVQAFQNYLRPWCQCGAPV